MSAWKEYKEKLGNTRPWDFLNPGIERAEDDVAASRYQQCLLCPQLVRNTKQCKECGCFMGLKVKLKDATCPLGKW